MKALVVIENGLAEMREVKTPDYGADEVLVRVKACAICGSDVHGYDGSSGRRQPPIIMGHEAAGMIECIGERVTRATESRSIQQSTVVHVIIAVKAW